LAALFGTMPVLRIAGGIRRIALLRPAKKLRGVLAFTIWACIIYGFAILSALIDVAVMALSSESTYISFFDIATQIMAFGMIILILVLNGFNKEYKNLMGGIINEQRELQPPQQ